MKKIYFLMITGLLFQSCVQDRDMESTVVVQQISAEPDGMHPFNDNSAYRSFIFQYTQKTLIKLDLKTLKYIPFLVESIPDGEGVNELEYNYTIKEGVKWDDGSALMAKDVEFTTKVVLCHLTNNAQIRGNYNTVIESINLDSEDPFKFTMKAQSLHVDNKYIFSEIYLQQKEYWDPKGILDDITFEQILSKDFEETEEITNWFKKLNSAENANEPDKLVGLGGYQVTEWEKDEYIIINKKNKWWGENDTSIYNQNFPDKIVFRIIKENSATSLALKSEKIDVTTSIGVAELNKLKQRKSFNDNYTSDFIDGYIYSYIGLNMKPDGIKHKKFFVDKRVRRAMAYLTPVDEIIKVFKYGQATRQVAQLSPLKENYNNSLELIPLDIEKAKELLEESGWIDTDGDNIRDKMVDGKKIQFSFNLSYMAKPESKEMALMIQESMYKAGIDAKPTPMDFKIFYSRAYKHDFDAMIGAWGGSASYSNPMQIWHTNSWVTQGSNFVGFGDAESNQLIKEANESTSLDSKQHKEAILKLQKRIYEDQPYVFLYARKMQIAIHKRFNNRNMYTERPGVILNNLLLSNKNLTPTTVE